jgi:DNA (cytosine-5)-methyltransferase 1
VIGVEYTLGSMFTGAGMLDRAVSQVLPVRPVWMAENGKAPSIVLANRFPGVPNLGDVAKVDWPEVEQVDVLIGGFPCQDVSLAGMRAGVRPGTRSGLWSWMRYAIGVQRPRVVIVENVRGLLNASAHSDMERCPWCLGDRDPELALRAFGAVLGDLADLGYDATWYGLPASAVGAPHERFRVFIIATPADQRHIGYVRGSTVLAGPTSDNLALLPTPQAAHISNATTLDSSRKHSNKLGPVIAGLPTLLTPTVGGIGGTQSHADEWANGQTLPTYQQRLSTQVLTAGTAYWGRFAPAIEQWERITGARAPEPVIPHGDGRRINPRFREWMMGWPIGWVTDYIRPDGERDPSRLSYADTITATGNGVVPQQAEYALRVLIERHRDTR